MVRAERRRFASGENFSVMVSRTISCEQISSFNFCVTEGPQGQDATYTRSKDIFLRCSLSLKQLIPSDITGLESLPTFKRNLKT